MAILSAEYGRRSALRGGNPYRSKAYIRAAENLAALAEPLEQIVDENRLHRSSLASETPSQTLSPSCTAPAPTSRLKASPDVPEGVLEMLSTNS